MKLICPNCRQRNSTETGDVCFCDKCIGQELNGEFIGLLDIPEYYSLKMKGYPLGKRERLATIFNMQDTLFGLNDEIFTNMYHEGLLYSYMRTMDVMEGKAIYLM
jgi:hypothetical protein